MGGMGMEGGQEDGVKVRGWKEGECQGMEVR